MSIVAFLTRFGVFLRALMRTGSACLLLLSVCIAATLGVGMSSVAYAESGQAIFSLHPVSYDAAEPLTKSYFIFDGTAGTVIKSSVRVTNSGTASGSAMLYPVDATTGTTSGAVYLNQSDPRKDVGAWLALSTPQVTLAAGQSQVVPFTVTIPASVRPGQHLGGIVAEAVTPSTSTAQNGNSNIQITVKHLTILAVQVNLPGTQVEHLSASGIQAGGQNGYQQLLLSLSNSGTDMLKPFGTLQIANEQGQVLKTFTLKLDTFLPQTAITYPIAVTGQGLGPGTYHATLSLSYGENQTLHTVMTLSIGQQQVTQVFSGTTQNKTVAPPGFASTSGFPNLPLWQLLLVAGGILAILWGVGNLLYKRLALSKAKAGAPSQMQRPF